MTADQGVAHGEHWLVTAAPGRQGAAELAAWPSSSQAISSCQPSWSSPAWSRTLKPRRDPDMVMVDRAEPVLWAEVYRD